jgi:hypothetical protein
MGVSFQLIQNARRLRSRAVSSIVGGSGRKSIGKQEGVMQAIGCHSLRHS